MFIKTTYARGTYDVDVRYTKQGTDHGSEGKCLKQANLSKKKSLFARKLINKMKWNNREPQI